MFLATLRMAASMAMLSNISNVKPRTDVLGQLMDIHDGNVIKVSSTANSESLYYWYGMGYLNCTETVGLIPPFDCPGIYKPFG